MDPNATLAEIRHLVDTGADHDELRTAVNALDHWLTAGGFLPDAWAARHTGIRYCRACGMTMSLIDGTYHAVAADPCTNPVGHRP